MKFIIGFLGFLVFVYGNPVENIEVPGEDAQGTEENLIKVESRIRGGNPAYPGQFPWQAAIQVQLEYVRFGWKLNDMSLCSGSLISVCHVISAAHCFEGVERTEFTNFYKATSAEVALGVTDASQVGDEVFTIKNFIIHPNWDKWTLMNDIAILPLSRSVTLTKSVYPVSLPKYDENLVGKYAIASGFGLKDTNSNDNGRNGYNLNYVAQKVISFNDCSKFFMTHVSQNSHLCTSNVSESGGTVAVCPGDSGGSLVLVKTDEYYPNKPILVGITSFGPQICGEGPSVFAKVSSYMNFIQTYVPNI